MKRRKQYENSYGSYFWDDNHSVLFMNELKKHENIRNQNL
jgi:hypothetical protein